MASMSQMRCNSISIGKPMLNELKLHRDVAVLESFSLNNIREMAYKLIPNIISEFKGFTSSFAPNEPAVQMTSKQKDFLKEISKHPYFDLGPLHVYVPEGLTTSYKRYCEALEGALQQVERVPEELSNYQTFISRLLTNEDDLKSTDYAKFKYDGMNKELDASAAETAKCFKKNDHTTEVKYSQVVQNNSEWTSVFNDVSKMVERIEAIDRSALLKKVADVNSILEMLQGKIKRQEIDNISSEMVAKIGEYTYIVARYLEYFSVTYYRVKALTECLNQTVDKVYAVCTRS